MNRQSTYPVVSDLSGPDSEPKHVGDLVCHRPEYWPEGFEDTWFELGIIVQSYGTDRHEVTAVDPPGSPLETPWVRVLFGPALCQRYHVSELMLVNSANQKKFK